MDGPAPAPSTAAAKRRASNAAYYQRRKADPAFKAARSEAVKRYYARNPDKRPTHKPTDLAVSRLERAINEKAAEMEELSARYFAMLRKRGELSEEDEADLASAPLFVD